MVARETVFPVFFGLHEVSKQKIFLFLVIQNLAAFTKFFNKLQYKFRTSAFPRIYYNGFHNSVII